MIYVSRSKDLAKNTLILSIGTFLPKFAALVTIPIITGHLTKVEYGTYDLITTLVALLLPVVTFQIHSAAFRFLIECRDNDQEKKRVITNIYVFLVPTAFVALIVLFFAYPSISYLSRFLIIFYFFVDILIMATQQVVRGLSMNKLFSLSAVIQSFVSMIMIVLTVGVADLGLDGVLVSLIVAASLGLIVLITRSEMIKHINLHLYSTNMIRKMLGYSWPMIPNTLSSWVLSASDRFVLTAFMGLEAIAVYAAANKIPQLFTSVQGTFIFAWQESASVALSDQDVEKYYSDMFDRIFSILSGIMSALIGVTPILFWLLIRGDYADAYSQMPILFMGIFFSALASFIGGIYVAHKKTKSVGITTMIAAACNLLIDFALIKSVGIYAASISTLVSYTLLAIYRMHDVKKFQIISYKYKKIGFSLFVLACMCIFCWINAFIINVINLMIGCVFAIVLNRKLIKDILTSLKYKMMKGCS